MDVGHWVDEYALSLRKGKNDCVILTAKNSRLLTVDNAGTFVPILGEDNFHVFVWKDGVGVHWRGKGDVIEGASREQMANYDLINSLGGFPGDPHYGGVTMLLIGLPDIFIREFSFRAQDYSSLHLVHLLLGRKHEVYEVEKFRVLFVDNAELLIQGVDDCIGRWGVIVDNGSGWGGAAVNGLERLLLAFIAC